MKTVVYVFPDERGIGKGKEIAGPNVPIADQIKLVTGIKNRNEYPEGYVRVDHFRLEPIQTGIKIAKPPKPHAEPKTKPEPKSHK